MGAFTDDVTDEIGRINVRLLAHAIDLPITTLAPALKFSVRWLNENPTSVKVQPKASVLLATVNALAAALGGRKYVVLYMKSPQPDFKGETPADQLKAGRLDYLSGYVDEVTTLRPD